MTQEQFWRLYESKEILCKIFRYENEKADNGELAAGEVIAFEYGSKFYLRIAENHAPAGYRRRYKNGGWSWAAIKEFDNRTAANSYFKKTFSQYSKI